MFGWIRTIHDHTALHNRAGLPLWCLHLLGEELRCLDKLGGRLGSRTLAYVVDGGGEEVLAELGGKEGGGLLLSLIAVERCGSDSPRLAAAGRRQSLLRHPVRILAYGGR